MSRKQLSTTSSVVFYNSFESLIVGDFWPLFLLHGGPFDTRPDGVVLKVLFLSVHSWNLSEGEEEIGTECLLL